MSGVTLSSLSCFSAQKAARSRMLLAVYLARMKASSVFHLKSRRLRSPLLATVARLFVQLGPGLQHSSPTSALAPSDSKASGRKSYDTALCRCRFDEGVRADEIAQRRDAARALVDAGGGALQRAEHSGGGRP